MKFGKIAILGGTGTLGRQLTDELLKNNRCDSILIYSRDEVKQLEMIEDFAEFSEKVIYRLGDVRDAARLEEVLQGMDIVIHAAAIKHVVMAENNPSECWKTNVIGTQNVVSACKSNKIKKAILISTDKAVNPIGIYGRSKKKAEEIFLQERGKNSHYNVIRLGNIFGSRGSVVDRFIKMSKKGVIEVTHADATRFCISTEEAGKFIIEHLSKESTEVISIPEMNAFRVVDLAKVISPTAEITITGLRPGDKVHEELSDGYSSDNSSMIDEVELKKLLDHL